MSRIRRMRPTRRRLPRIKKLNPKEREQSIVITAALDVLTEFGAEHESRERLLHRIGGAVALLHLLRNAL